MGIFSDITSAIGGVVGDVSSALGGFNPVGSLISGGLSLLGGQQQTNSAQASVASQEQFQEQMSDTAYQRSVADMTKAGLNPMLAGMNQSPASTPMGANIGMPPNVIGNAVNTGMQGAMTAAQLQSTLKDIDLKETQATKNWADTQYTAAQTKLSNSAAAAAANASDIAKGDFGKTLSYINALSTALHGAGQGVTSARGALSSGD